VNDIRRWFAISRSEEIPARHVVQTQLLGQEIAVWRDDTGLVNAWENRCPHRGVRLSIGFNTGMELRCQYHGWRFATGSGRCTAIPAHPAQKPATTIRAVPYDCIESHGFVWSTLGQSREPPTLPIPLTQPAMTLRSIFIEAAAAAVAQALLPGYPLFESIADVVAHDAFTLTATPDHTIPNANDDAAVTFLLQPVTASRTVVHGLLHAGPTGTERMAVLRHHNSRMTALRDALEMDNA
jgi:nitrite reductase/ring-hydroxylating ferredoxin subunit